MLAKLEIRIREAVFRGWERTVHADPDFIFEGDLMDAHNIERCTHCGSDSGLHSIKTRQLSTGAIDQFVVCFLCFEQMEVPEGEGE